MQRPRLRDKNGREVAVPAYDRLHDDTNIDARVRDILVAGVSTRRYAAVLPEAAGLLGVSKSPVSRRLIEALPSANARTSSAAAPAAPTRCATSWSGGPRPRRRRPRR